MFPNRNKEFKGYTMVSNTLIEDVFPKLNSLSDSKLILHIYRNTAGIITGVDDHGEPVFRRYYFITVRRLAELLQMDHKSIITGLKRLEEGGYIVKTIENGKTGYGLKFQEE